jgi:alkanesulfonate monooxygenase SsuD/methylene tetrahydromethanopterin reductase-like flavin-dependent oxidoreductase (luciferase family)
VTERLVLSNSIYIAGARPLLTVAKQVATASVLSGGRVALGVGAGWMREEFELMGQSFDDRGPRLNEMMEALRELWKGGWVEWHGKHYEVPALMMEPHPAEPIPIYCGGHTDAALKRAARYGDGWIGNAYPWDEAAGHVGRLQGYLREYGRENDPFEIIVGFYDLPSVDLYKRAEGELGVTGTMCMPWAGMSDVSGGAHAGLLQSAERYREPIERFAEQIVDKAR